MNIKYKNLLSFSLALAFSLLSLLTLYAPTKVFADSSESNEAFEYEINEDGKSITITAYKGLGGSVTVPSSIDGREVTAIGKAAFASCSQIEVLSMPVSVAEIGELAFSGCSGIEEISIPDEVLEIGKMAFANCTSLKTVNFGEKLNSVGAYAFIGCTTLSEIILPDNTEKIGEYAFYNCRSLKTLGELPNIKTVGGHAFENTAWTDEYEGDYIILGDGILISYLGNAEKLTLDKSIKTVGASAFFNNKTVKTLKTSENTTAIQEEAFEGSALESVDLTASGVSVGASAFKDCEKLTEIKFSDKTSAIGKGAFEGCTALESVTLPSSLKKLESLTFADCSSLKSMNLSEVKTLGSQAFKSCTALGIIEIPKSVTDIEDSCFEDCVSLTRAVVKGNSTIKAAFPGCNNLEEAAFYSSNVSIDENAFTDSASLTIYASSGSTAAGFAGEKHYECKTLSEFESTSYSYKGVLEAGESDDFSGGYTFIMIMIIVADCVVAFSISAYVLLRGPGKKAMRHAKP